MRTLRYVLSSWRELLVGTIVGVVGLAVFYASGCPHMIHNAAAAVADVDVAGWVTIRQSDAVVAFLGARHAPTP